MKKLQPYFPVLIALARNLFRLGRDVVRQVLLPGRKRKGNVLSSVYELFVGCSEELIQFREELLAIPLPVARPVPGGRWVGEAWRHGRRYIRLGIMVVAWGLFILASLEGAGADRFQNGETRTTANVAETRAVDALSARYIDGYYPVPPAAERISDIVVDRPPADPAVKRWLLFRALLV